MMTIQGDPDQLVAKLQEKVEPVAAKKAREYGGVSTTVARTDDGIMIINMWSNEEGRHRMAEDPEIQQALREAGFPAPAFKAYEVLVHRTPD